MTGTPAATNPTRLCNDDFIALRSISRSRWVQGREIQWKFNRSWLSIPFSRAALDAAFRLEKMGLVENFVCCNTCGEVFQLTEAGRARARQMDRSLMAKAVDGSPAEAQPLESARWFRRVVQVITAHISR